MRELNISNASAHSERHPILIPIPIASGKWDPILPEPCVKVLRRHVQREIHEHQYATLFACFAVWGGLVLVEAVRPGRQIGCSVSLDTVVCC
jgi:hypothetical protein